MEHLLNVFLVLQESFWPQLHDLFVIILQLREPHFHASNACSVGTFVN